MEINNFYMGNVRDKDIDITFFDKQKEIRKRLNFMFDNGIEPCNSCHFQCDLINVMKETNAGIKHYIRHPITAIRLIKKIYKTRNPYF